MFQKVKNIVHVNVEGAKLTTLKNNKFYVKQGPLNFEYVPTIINDEEMIVEIPKADADRLKFTEPVRLQFIGTDPSGLPVPVPVVETTVNELLAPEGYDGG